MVTKYPQAWTIIISRIIQTKLLAAKCNLIFMQDPALYNQSHIIGFKPLMSLYTASVP
jgi:hypothetical protein